MGTPLSDERRHALTRAVVALHHNHALHLDTEVAYEVKLHASHVEVDAALALHGFTIYHDGTLWVAPVVAQPYFLNSQAFKLRLILNTLTTPHVFLGGDVHLYRRHCTEAERAVALVALSLLDEAGRFSVAEAANALVTGPDGAAGEDFLGYAHGPALYSTVQRGLAHLVTDAVVRAIDGMHFDQDRERRSQIVANLHGPASTLPRAPGTMAA